MTPTIQDGQVLISKKVKSNNLKYGDIITFYAPSVSYQTKAVADLNNPVAIYSKQDENITYIKRIIGLPGDHIEIKDGNVYVNNNILQEEYLEENIKTDDMDGVYIDITVPDKCVYVLGDNRPVSGDSRRFGCIPFDKVIGKIFINK